MKTILDNSLLITSQKNDSNFINNFITYLKFNNIRDHKKES